MTVLLSYIIACMLWKQETERMCVDVREITSDAFYCVDLMVSDAEPDEGSLASTGNRTTCHRKCGRQSWGLR